MRVLTPAPRDVWADALAQDPMALADHTPAWSAAVTRGRWRDASRAYLLDDGRSAVLPLVRRATLPWFASNPPGWGFGGLVGNAARDPDLVAAVVDDLAGLGVVVRIRPLPQDAHLWPTGIPRRSHVLDLSPGPAALLAGMRTSTRRYARKDFDVASGDLTAYEQLWHLSVDRWATRQGEPLALARRRALFRDPPSRMRRLSEALGPDFRIWVAYSSGRAVAANVVVFGRGAHATRAVSDTEHAPAGVMQHLDWLGIQEACARGCSVLHLGESGTSTSLAFYKEGFGARPVDYSEVRLERVPVTRVDALARSAVKRLIGFRD